MLRLVKGGGDAADKTVRPLHVLIVDDDDADTMLMEEALESALVPPVVSRVADGQQALDFLYQRGQFAYARRPDLVLLDLNMPRVGGQEVLARIKDDRELSVIPIVVLTTASADRDVLGSYGLLANAFVTKPTDPESFETAVRTINDFYAQVATHAHVRWLRSVPESGLTAT